MNIQDFAANYQGFDASFFISLFEYGFIYSYTDPLSKGDLRVWYKVKENQFNWADFSKDLDFWKEFNWIKKDSFLSTFGYTNEEFDKESLERKIYFTMVFYGPEEICGTAYHPTIVEE